MSWAAVAVAGATVVGAAVSSKGAKDAAKESSKAQEAQVAFAREQYADWQAVYGPMQDNLSAYYANVTPDYYEAIGLEAVQREFDTVRADVERTLAQRGIQDTGAALALEQDLAIQEAQAKAVVRRDAPSMAREEQSRFLQIGMGLNPSGSVSQALSQAAQTAAVNSQYASQAAGQATGQAIGAIGQVAAKYFDQRSATAPAGRETGLGGYTPKGA